MEDNIRLLKPYLRGLPIILLALLLGVMTAKKYLSYTTPMYESTVKLRLADKGEGTPGSNLFKDLDVFASSNKIAAEIEILKSQVLLNKVSQTIDFDVEVYRVGKIRTIELYQNAPIIIHYEGLKEIGLDRTYELVMLNNTQFELNIPTTYEKLNGVINTPLETSVGKLLITLNDSLINESKLLQVVGSYKFVINSKEKLFEKLSKNLDITSVDKDVAVIRISYKSVNPVKASKFVNKLAEVYIQDYIESKYKAASVTVDFLNDQINRVIEKVTKSENNIQSYRDNEGITNISQETETDLRKISQLKIQQTNLKMSLDAIQELDRYIAKGKENFLDLAPNFEAFNDLLSTEIVKKIKALQSEKKDLLIVYTKEDARVKVIDAKMLDLTNYLIESIRNTRKNLETKYRNLNADIQTAEQVFIGVPEKEKMLNIMNREFNIYQQSYNFLNEKKIEAEIAQSAKIAFHRIISPGIVAKEPVSPNRTIIIIISAFLGMIGSIVIIFLVHKFKAKVNDLYTIESTSNIPVALKTPMLKGSNEIKNHFLKEAIQLEIKGLVTIRSVICLTAYSTKDGCAFNALNLALAFAAQERRVLLIDLVGQLRDADFKSQLTNEKIEIKNLSNNNYLKFTQSKMKELIDGYKQEYDLVIILNEPFESDLKTRLLLSVADLNLIVFDSRRTAKKRIQQTDLMQEDFKFAAMHILLNRAAYNPNIITDFVKIVRKVSQVVFKKIKNN